jgi:hypothetical protein
LLDNRRPPPPTRASRAHVLGAAGLAGVAGVASATRPRGAHHPGGGSSHESPAIRTIERIVGIVPLAVWITVGVLAAFSLLLAGGSWLTAARARRIERQRRRLSEDVGALQAALLPSVPRRMGEVRSSVAYRPADGPAAGGDFYDVFARRDGRLVVVMGDVSGHGRAALRQTALIRYTLRAYVDAGMTPRAALRTAEATLDAPLEGALATAAVALYGPRERVLTYACAGHAPPLVIGTSSLEPVLECSSPPLGLGSPTGLRETTVAIPGSACVCFFTDGVVEARIDGELFGVRRLISTLQELGSTANAEALLERVVACSDARADDMSACLLSVPGSRLAPVISAEELELDDADLAGPRAEAFLAAYGVQRPRMDEALEVARATVDRLGAAVMHVRVDLRTPEVTVEPPGGQITWQRVDVPGAPLRKPPSSLRARARGRGEVNGDATRISRRP